MKNISLQDRKLNLIEKLVIVNDLHVINQLEAILNFQIGNEGFEPFSQQDIINRANLSELNIINGEVYSQDEVEKISKEW